MRFMRTLKTVVVVGLFGGAPVAAQTPATDASTRLKQVLPADVAARVLAVIAKARSRELPAEALENRALKFAARGIRPDSIERSVVEQEARMEVAKDLLETARGQKAVDDEIEAAAEALRKGAHGAKVSALAKSAPKDRSLAVPLYVVGSLLDRGLNSDDALARVSDRLKARASDRDLESLPSEVPVPSAAAQTHRPTETGRALAETKRAAGGSPGNGAGGGPPASVPGNGGAKAKPNNPRKPTPPGKKP